MILNAEKYKHLETLLSENNADLPDTVNELNDSLLDESISLFNAGMYEDLNKELDSSKRFKVLFEQSYSKTLDYYIGYFHAVTTAFNVLVNREIEDDTFEKEMNALSEKASVKKILFYLLDHSDSQHKVIAEKAGVTPSHLSQLMRELEDTGCVERYASGKRSFYSLSLRGQAFTKKIKEKAELSENRPKLLSSYNKDITSLHYAPDYIFSILDEGKYSVPYLVEVKSRCTSKNINIYHYINNIRKNSLPSIVSDLNSIDKRWIQEVKHTDSLSDLKDESQKRKIVQLLYALRNCEKSGNEHDIQEFRTSLSDDETSNYLLNYANSSLVYYFNLTQVRELEKTDYASVQEFLKETMDKYVIRFNPTYISSYEKYHFPDEESAHGTMRAIEYLTKYYVYHLFGKEFISRDFRQETDLSQQTCDYYADLVNENFEQIKMNLLLQNTRKSNWYHHKAEPMSISDY